MFYNAKCIKLNDLEHAISKRFNIPNVSWVLDRCFFQDCEKDSYNELSIGTIKDFIDDLKYDYPNSNFKKDSLEEIDYLCAKCLLDIYEESSIKEEDTVLVYVSW